MGLGLTLKVSQTENLIFLMEGKRMKNAKMMSLSIMVKDQYNNNWSVHQENDTIVVRKNRTVMTTRCIDGKAAPSILIRELKRSASDNFCVLSL